LMVDAFNRSTRRGSPLGLTGCPPVEVPPCPFSPWTKRSASDSHEILALLKARLTPGSLISGGN
jgi:hypothetical protein